MEGGGWLVGLPLDIRTLILQKGRAKYHFFTQCQTFISSTSSTFLKSLRVVTVFDIVDQSWHEMDS